MKSLVISIFFKRQPPNGIHGKPNDKTLRNLNRKTGMILKHGCIRVFSIEDDYLLIKKNNGAKFAYLPYFQ
jgi:hypothetical protein